MGKQALDGESVLVLGGSSGIGLATALAAAELGGRVTITGRDEARLRQAADTADGAVGTQVLDVADGDGVRRVLSELGSLDHLVLVPGSAGGLGPLAMLDLDEVRLALDKPMTFLAAIQAALPVLRPGGSVTMVGGRAASTAAPGAVALAMASGAVEAMVPTLAAELAPVRVNAVSPAVIDTAWWSAFPPPMVARIFELYGEVAAVGRAGRAEDVASAIVALLTNGFITGVVLPLDGGARDPGGVFGVAAAEAAAAARG